MKSIMSKSFSFNGTIFVNEEISEKEFKKAIAESKGASARNKVCTTTNANGGAGGPTSSPCVTVCLN